MRFVAGADYASRELTNLVSRNKVLIRSRVAEKSVGDAVGVA